jgi:small subunit ribosomal protein S13
MVAGRVKDPEKKKKKERVEEKKQKEKPKDKGLRVVVRLVNTDLDGEKKVFYALRKIKGVSYSMAKAICNVAGIDPNEKLGALDENALEKLKDVIKDPAKHGVPVWILNRRKDRESGSDMHVSGVDVKVSEKFDIKDMIDKKSYKGVRHMLGLPVRGQRTKSSFRKGKTVGVVRKKMRMVAAKAKEKK